MNKPKTLNEIRDLYIKFFESRGHKEAPNASLVPLNDPSVLFTTAGMHPLVPYLLGQPHPLGNRLVNIQKCVRTNDIEEVGDTTHLTFFEMMGYWSLGDYFKEEAIEMTFEFFTSKEYMNFDPNRLYVTTFEGDEDAPEDNDSIKKWQEVFKSKNIDAKVWNKENFDNNPRIFPQGKDENWWGPAGQTGPCGPDSELFYWRGQGQPDFNKFVPWDDSGMFIEISNDVFMEFNKEDNGNFTPLSQKNVDFGSGLERVAMIEQMKSEDGSFPISVSLYDTDIFKPIIQKIESIFNVQYEPDNENTFEITKSIRVIAEHSRSAVFILADGITPGSKDQGYVLRRLIRRMVRHGLKLGENVDFTKDIALVVIDQMKEIYPHLEENKNTIINGIDSEEIKFRRTISNGVKELRKMIDSKEELNGEAAFYIYETYGFPLELTLEEFNLSEEEAITITDQFNASKTRHQEMSRAGAEQKFKGGLADQSEEVTKLHTAHHLLLKALQEVLGDHVKQRGSNITGERLRIDFEHGESLTPEQIEKVEKIVNEQISNSLDVVRVEIAKVEAEKIQGVQQEFGQKYPEVVTVYVIGENLGSEEKALERLKEGDFFSAEFCGGPHVTNTMKIGENDKTFKISKQESIGSGKRRMKGVLQ